MIKMLDPSKFTVLVTGATSGFGAAFCRRFHGAGARIVATGRRTDRLAALKAELGERCHTIAVDVTDRAAMLAAIAALPKPFDEIDVCIANAGLALGMEPAHEASLDDWDRMVATNINGMLYTVRAVLPGMVARDRGHIVLLGSVAGDYAYPGGNTYGGTKAFVKQFALNLRADLLGAHVRVTNIEPGMAETEFSLVRFKGDDGKADKVYENIESMTADEIAECVMFACTMPAHFNLNRMQMMPVMQSFGPSAIKRG